MAQMQHWTENRKLMPKFARALERRMSGRRLQNEATTRLYYAKPVLRSTDLEKPVTPSMEAFSSLTHLGFNLSREVIDASYAQVCDPIGTKVTPVGADRKVQYGCKQLTRMCDAIRDEVDWMALKQQAYKDACTTDLGATKIYIDRETGEVKAERADPMTLYFDPSEGRNPYCFYEITDASRWTLAAMFPKHRSRIMDQPRWTRPFVLGADEQGHGTADMIRITSAWARKVGEVQGAASMQLDDGTELLEGDDLVWEYEFFPFAFMRWDWDFRGFGGLPLGRVLAPYHAWSNRLVMTWYKSLKGAIPRTFIHENAEVDAFTDQEFEKVVWGGQIPPEIKAANTVPTDIPEAIEQLRDRAHAEGGVNRLAAAGTRPAGVNSAPAQREFMDMTHARQKQVKIHNERYDGSGTNIMCALMRKAYKTKAMRVKAPGSKYLEQMKFPNLKEDQYQVSVQVTSGLSSTITGRMEQLGELREQGDITQGDYLRNLNLPDIERVTDRVNAPQDLAEMMISMCLDEEEPKFIMPMAFPALLDAIVNTGRLEYQRAIVVGGYPRENTEALRRLIAAAEARMPPPAPAPLPAPPAAPPLGPPAPPAGAAMPPVV